MYLRPQSGLLDMRAYDTLRLRHGLNWRSKYPPVPWVQMRRLLLVLGMFALASSLDYYIERAYWAERAADIYAAQARVLHDCERGAIGYHYQDGRTYQCGGKL